MAWQSTREKNGAGENAQRKRPIPIFGEGTT
jgi:hypothetical protein